MWSFLEKHFEEVLTAILVMFMASMVFFQVVMRYVFSLPTSWSDELAIYAMLWSVYISVAWAVRERAHIRVMNFVQLFPKKVEVALTIFSDFIWFIFSFSFFFLLDVSCNHLYHRDLFQAINLEGHLHYHNYNQSICDVVDDENQQSLIF